VRLFSQLRGNVWTRDCDDLARVCMDFSDGAVGMVEINTTTTRPLPRWHVDGTRGSAESPYSLAFDLDEWAKVEFRPAEAGGPAPEGAGLAAPGMLPRATGTMNETQIWERFAAAVRGEGEPAVTVESVLPTMRLLDAARESSRKGCAVEVGNKTRGMDASPMGSRRPAVGFKEKKKPLRGESHGRGAHATIRT